MNIFIMLIFCMASAGIVHCAGKDTDEAKFTVKLLSIMLLGLSSSSLLLRVLAPHML